MNRLKWIALAFIVLVGGFVGWRVLEAPRKNSSLETSAHEGQKDVIYTCPMHPEIRQHEPGKCPICGMTLVKADGHDHGSAKPSQFDLSTYQAQISGLKIVKVEKKSVSFQLSVTGRFVSGHTVAFQVFERDFANVKPGLRFHGQAEAWPSEELSGRVVSVDSFVDPSSRTIRVLGAIEKPARAFPQESSFVGSFEIPMGDQLVVPEDAVLFTGQGSYVYRTLENEQVAPQKVQVGPRTGESYVIQGGVEEGEAVLAGPNFLLDSEARIRGLNDQTHH